MKVLYGNVILGNFKSSRDLERFDILSIEKINQVLHVITAKNRIPLTPFEDEKSAKELVNNFSLYQGEDNESLYDFEVIDKNHIVIMLSVFEFETKRIETDIASLHIYPDRDLSKKIVGFGYADPIKYLTDEFIQNKSVIASVNDKNRLSIYGQKYRGDIVQERPGVFRIFNLVINRSKGDVRGIRQIFGKIKFISLEESLSKDSQPLDFRNIDTEIMFTVWDLYTDFLDEEFTKEIINRGCLFYESVTKLGENRIRLQFNIPNPNRTSLFMGGIDDEYEVILYENDDHYKSIKSVKDIYDNPQDSYNRVNIGRVSKVYDDSIVFEATHNIGEINPKGCVLLSSQGISIEKSRRKKTIDKIKRSPNPTLRTLRNLIANNHFVDSQLGASYAPVSSNTIFTMFGDSNFQINENFREAINIAINTPDFALIQGPPGTGKTTLIKGIVARLSEIYKNVRILVSSEQHEALYNVVEKLSDNNQIPPYIISKQRNSDYKRTDKLFIDNVIDFQNSLIDLCRSLKENSDVDQNPKRLIAILNNHFIKIRNENYSTDVVKDAIVDVKRTLFDLGIFGECKDQVDALNESILHNENQYQLSQSPEVILLQRRIQNQRLTIIQFSDDGSTQLKILQDSLRANRRYDLLINPKLEESMYSGDLVVVEQSLPAFCEYINKINKLISVDEDEMSSNKMNVKEAAIELEKRVRGVLFDKPQTISDILDEFSLVCGDLNNCISTVKKYSKVIASTCAQSKSYKRITNLTEEFDYVIIDEAARANPVDIMIPMLFANKVILVGDQAQLPQYVDNSKVDKFLKMKEEDYKNYLTKSLFSMLFEAAEKSWIEDRIKFKRHIQIQVQHRMHPTIGEFISKTFYDSKVVHSDQTKNHGNDFGVFDGKSIVWLDMSNQIEYEKKEESFYRVSEAKETIEVLKELFRKNPDRKMRIGVISYYKKQVRLLNDLISEQLADYMKNQIDCNTVDSFQGKEFDIVILSTVRSNFGSTGEESIGFIHHSKNRINVSLSRARKLLVVIGDASTFSRNPIFRSFISYVKEVGHYESKSR
jgi:superfamily I DNA and/or RNA helicase